jgi:hypothetical protein
MHDRAGSRDDHPPVLLFGDDYQFAAISKSADHFALYRSTHSEIDKATIVSRLREIADSIEASDGGERR